MDFALKQMKAMGWTEGKGLGLDENGIIKPIKPNVQKDTRGLGFTVEDSIQLKNQWWKDAYNAASKGVKTDYKITSVGVIVKPKNQSPSRSPDDGYETDKTYNQNFVSAGLLDGDSHTTKTNSTKNKKKKESEDERQKSMDFNAIFQDTNGLTCHKAARLGIKMNGKLKRIEEQEQKFFKKLKK